jgi:hypothetical protein
MASPAFRRWHTRNGLASQVDSSYAKELADGMTVAPGLASGAPNRLAEVAEV